MGAEGIFNPWRHLSEILADNNFVLLQRPKLKGEHALGDVRQQAAQFVEAARTFLQLKQYHGFPFAADHIDCCRNRTPGFMKHHFAPMLHTAAV
jgi:hypothetical protein